MPADVSAQFETRPLMPDAMTMVALERQSLHDKILRLRALREAAEAQGTSADAKITPARR